MAGGLAASGRRGRGRRSSRRGRLSEINVTPFVDVMLVLLIIFMVTAPLLTVGVPVELPRDARQLPSETAPLAVPSRGRAITSRKPGDGGQAGHHRQRFRAKGTIVASSFAPTPPPITGPWPT